MNGCGRLLDDRRRVDDHREPGAGSKAIEYVVAGGRGGIAESLDAASGIRSDFTLLME
jgi:hypothetical protein